MITYMRELKIYKDKREDPTKPIFEIVKTELPLPDGSYGYPQFKGFEESELYVVAIGDTEFAYTNVDSIIRWWQTLTGDLIRDIRELDV